MWFNSIQLLLVYLFVAKSGSVQCPADHDCDKEHGSCMMTGGIPYCKCNSGFAGNGKNCQDVDECIHNTDDCDVNADCLNTAGGYKCACRDGYSGNGRNCSDVDECAIKMCHQGAICDNTEGSFLCQCKLGWTGDGFTCTETGECPSDNDCDKANGSCRVMAGISICMCNPGFAGNGKNCQDVDECTRGTDDCDVNEDCLNTAGGYECACRDGYSGNGRNCSELQRCDPACDDVHSSCDNGKCKCATGFASRLGVCTATCAPITMTTDDGQKILFGEGFVNTLVFSESTCSGGSAHGQPMGSIFCSPTFPASYDPTSFDSYDCNANLSNFLQVNRDANISSSDPTSVALGRTTAQLAWLVTAESNLTREQITEVVSFMTKISDSIQTHQSQLNLQTLNYVVNTANVIVNPINQEEFMDTPALGNRVIQSLKTVASHVTSDVKEKEEKIETDNVVLLISPRLAASKSAERFKLRMTSSSSEEESVEVELPAEVFAMVSSSSRRISRNAQIAPTKSVIFAVRGGKLFNATTVVSVNVGNVTIANLNQPIKIDFRNTRTINDGDATNKSLSQHETQVRCVYWDERDEVWSSRGLCRIRNTTSCRSSHLTSFSILVSHREVLGEVVLSMISRIGCATSAVCLLLTIIIHLAVRKVRRIPQTRIFLHICVLLTVLYFLFIFGITRTGQELVCTTVAAFLHYVIITSWAWMAVYIQCIHTTLSDVTKATSAYYVTKASVFAYGVPLMVVGGTAIVMYFIGFTDLEICGKETSFHLAYRSSRVCWIHQSALTYGFVFPCALFLLFNLIKYILVMRILVWKNIRPKKNIKRQVFIGATMATTLGFTWIFGYLMLVSTDVHYQTIFSWIFSLSTAFQGLIMFIMTVMHRAELRNPWFLPLKRTLTTSVARFSRRVDWFSGKEGTEKLAPSEPSVSYVNFVSATTSATTTRMKVSEETSSNT